jgi:hypothetical protein
VWQLLLAVGRRAGTGQSATGVVAKGSFFFGFGREAVLKEREKNI